MRNILLINGNPKKNSFSRQLCDTYERQARDNSHVHRLDISDMAFNPSLEHGYDSVQELEPCLKAFQSAIVQADHLVIVSPIWWGGLPAKLKGLLDRTFLPGFAFKYESRSAEPIPLLTGKTARIIFTMDAPEDFAAEQSRPALEQLDRFTLQFSGICAAQVTLFGSVIMADELKKEEWIQSVANMAAESEKLSAAIP
ncbi:NAD(P)H-dependent oxidoreductase [Microbulbifer marinus]|uniref:Putative NADPH-quinone reductase (Modulator of drug activity B) n=1 Tax=Microbulbifer marinus TaxID=658218 RepID=A0A1H3VTL4_9GAMM|nr:NAD(P)H-dependent oxidoreductase [Microbulbifer marinus]SDZ78109.1 Putative NADPH-quinone reductase (modulator of drug activity B) [Microbulbifer marinus]